MTADLSTLAVTPRFRWRVRDSWQDKWGDPDFFEAFCSTRREKLLGSQETEACQNLLKLLPEPQSFKDIDKAVKRILHAMDVGERITVFGDYDVDGTTSCAMLRRFFTEIGYPIDVYIPERLVEGYGLNPVGVQNVHQTGSSLIITVDNGISAVQACDVAKKLGIDVIITDHHDLPPVLPEAFAILNPKQPDCRFPFRMLAGVGVAFYLLIALRAALREKDAKRYGAINLRSYMDYVALGTIADLAPLDGVNHILCKVGLEVMFQHVTQGQRPGVLALLELTGWNLDSSRIDSTDVGFKLGPCLNASGRLGNALASEEILSTTDATKARELALFLTGENSERQKIEKTIREEAFRQVTEFGKVPSALVLHAPHWHPGVVGIVASRVLEKFYRPTLILGTMDGKIKGSGRSTHAFDLFRALNEVRGEFVSFGGHFHAVGLTMDEQKLLWLRSHLEACARQQIETCDMIQPLVLDGCLNLAWVDMKLLEKLGELEPFGIENPRPKWLIQNAEIRHVKRIGKDVSQNHARILVSDKTGETWLTAFGMAEQMEQIQRSRSRLDLAVEAKIGIYKGVRRQEMKLIDFHCTD